MNKSDLLDFSKMRIDLSRITPGQVFLNVFPEYQHLKCYQNATEDEIKVAILLCDRRGPFSSIRNFQERLNAIFNWMDYALEGAKLEFYDEVLSLKNDHIADIWTEYLAACFDHEWTSWFSNSVMYYQIMRELRKPLGISLDAETDKETESKWMRRMSLEKKADEIYKKMKDMEAIIFNDEQVKRRAHEREQQKLIENYPEKFSQANSVV